MVARQHDLGSVWRKWDLHFHTPGSFDYKNKSLTNQNLIDALKSKGIKAVAVTDHNTFDVTRIKDLQKLGKKNEIVVFPGIELRGDKRDKSPINLIGIFADDCDLDFVASEVLTKLDINKQRNIDKRGEDAIYVDTFKACELIRDLGGLVTIHAGNKSNSIEECYPNALPVNIAEKLDLIDKVDIFEIATLQDIVNYRAKVFPNINRVLSTIKTSDNHDASLYEFKDDNYCWIKADLTFEGLKQIIYEPVDRVYVGPEPPVIDRVRSNKTKYMNTLTINQKESYRGVKGVWFKDQKIELNKELIAVIGNKGSGKSALSDIIGLLGNTHNAGIQHENLSFLNGKAPKFRKKGYAENFEAEMVWEDGSGTNDFITLSDNVDFDTAEKVKYLPQNYFENITNDLEGDGFDKTLKSVIFLHLPEEHRLGARTFSELEDKKAKNIEIDLIDLRDQIHQLSEDIIKLEEKRHPSNKKRLESLIAEKQKELDEHVKNKPPKAVDPSTLEAVPNPEKSKKYERLEELNKLEESLNTNIANERASLIRITKEKEDLSQVSTSLERLKSQVETYKIGHADIFKKYALDIDTIIKTAFDSSSISEKINERISEISLISEKLRSKSSIESDPIISADPKKLASALKKSLTTQLEKTLSAITEIKKDLSRPEKEFQDYKEKLAKWDKRKSEIEGSSVQLGSLKFYKAEKSYIDNKLDLELTTLRTRRLEKSVEIFNKQKEVINLYTTFKKSIDEEITKDKDFSEKFKMLIDVNFKLSSDFTKIFLSYINKTKAGTFYGSGEKEINEILAEKNLLDEKDISSILNAIVKYLENDQRFADGQPIPREIADQVGKVQDFYDFVFSLEYLTPIYELKLDGKILDELSPGEKGTLLLVFYLMIDKEDTPLIIDQPEDNLDNKSVFQVLTHFIKTAKKRRQIIIITHNPNLAVGADAEQIVYVELDKKDNQNIFSFESGSIESPRINELLVEILEGTMPAFDKRKLRYKK